MEEYEKDLETLARDGRAAIVDAGRRLGSVISKLTQDLAAAQESAKPKDDAPKGKKPSKLK